MVLTGSLVAYYDFDETSGFLLDLTGNGNTGSVNGPTRNQAGIIGSSYSFDGTNDWIEIDTVSTSNNDWSISLWFKTNFTPDANYRYFFDNYNGGASRQLMGVETLAAGGSLISTFQNSIKKVGNFGHYNDGNWHHMVSVADNTTGLVYVDNSLLVNTTISTTNIAGDTGIGANRLGTANFSSGLIDEMGLWDRALTSSEVSQLYNGGAGLAYPFTVGSSAPTIQASGITFSDVSSSGLTAVWHNGNGGSRAAFMIQSDTGTGSPVNNNNYVADSDFGNGTQIGTTGWYCVYNGIGSEVIVGSLVQNTTYRMFVTEYNGTSGNEVYLGSTASENPNNQVTLIDYPTVQSTTINFSSVSNNSFTVSCNAGDGGSRVIFLKETSTGSAVPVDNTTYTANSSFGDGDQIGVTGWYCVYNGNGSSVSINNLSSGTTYRAHSLEYNG